MIPLFGICPGQNLVSKIEAAIRVIEGLSLFPIGRMHMDHMHNLGVGDAINPFVPNGDDVIGRNHVYGDCDGKKLVSKTKAAIRVIEGLSLFPIGRMHMDHVHNLGVDDAINLFVPNDDDVVDRSPARSGPQAHCPCIVFRRDQRAVGDGDRRL